MSKYSPAYLRKIVENQRAKEQMFRRMSEGYYLDESFYHRNSLQEPIDFSAANRLKQKQDQDLTIDLFTHTPPSAFESALLTLKSLSIPNDSDDSVVSS